MTTLLETSTSQNRLKPEALIAQIKAVVLDPALRPFMALWLELVARAARNEAPYAEASAVIATGFLDWTKQQLDVSPARRDEEALKVLAQIEGLVLLQAAGLKINPRD